MFRMVWIGLALILIGTPVAVFLLAKAAEHVLATERQVGEWKLQFHGVHISPLLAVEVDSGAAESPYEKVFLSKASVHLLGWVHFGSRPAEIHVVLDSANVRVVPRPKTGKPVTEFPALRFPLPVSVEWRILNVVPESLPAISVERARWSSSGPWGLNGRFHVRGVFADSALPPLEADLTLAVRWYGKSVHYRLQASHAGDSVEVVGEHENKFLPHGQDSLYVALGSPRRWLPAKWLRNAPEITGVKVGGKIDWKREKFSLAFTAHTDSFHILESALWHLKLVCDSIGGEVRLSGQGSLRQQLHLEGQWRHPPEWLVKPDWKKYGALLAMRTKGVYWRVGTHELPIEFEIPSLRLEQGLIAEANVVSSDSSRVELRWNGEHAKRLEFSGDVSPGERWAVIWTDTNVAFHSGKIEGVWEKNNVHVVSRLRNTRAYGAVADSVELVQDINIDSAGYFLRSSRIYHDGQVFQGSGHVIWARYPGFKGPKLAFDLSHAEFGRVRFRMQVPDSIEVDAENLQAGYFPYRPLHRLSRFHPEVDGHFAWNPVSGGGASDLSAVFAYEGKSLKGRAEFSWDRERMKIFNGELHSGAASLSGGAEISLEGRSLAGLSHLHPGSVKSWRLHADELQIGEVLELAKASADGHVPVNGTLNGNIQYDASNGWLGNLKARDLQVPALEGILQVSDVSLNGRGDSLLISASSTSTKHPLLADTLDAVLLGLGTERPRLTIGARSGPLTVDFAGAFENWTMLRGNLKAAGRAKLGGEAGFLDAVNLQGDLSMPLSGNIWEGTAFSSRTLSLLYISALDTQRVDGGLTLERGVLTSRNLRIRNSQGGSLTGELRARLEAPVSVNFQFEGDELRLALPQGQKIHGRGVTGHLDWTAGTTFNLNARVASGTFQMPVSGSQMQSGFDGLIFAMSIPPADAVEVPKLLLRTRARDFFFQRRVGFKEVVGYLNVFKRSKGGGGSAHRSKPWELDVDVEAIGSNNRVDTDVLRLNFLGDLHIKGVYPYTLFNGKVSGLRGEIGLSGQVYDLRDFEVKWDNATLDEGTIYAEGEKKVLVDCQPNTRSTCPIYIKLNGELREMNFSYDTDCGKTVGTTSQPVSPTVVISWAKQGCATSVQGDVKAALIDATVSQFSSQGIKAVSGGFIQSTQVSGLGAHVGGGDSSSTYEPYSVEVQTKEKYRVSLKGRAGYYPERKLANPWEGKLGIEYRPPLEELVSDSASREKIKDRWTVEASVETRPPDHLDVEEERQVRQQVGLRYHYRFWNWW
jgi:ribosomal protein S6E (S10)